MCDQSFEQAQSLNLKSVAFIVVSQGHDQAAKLRGTSLDGTNAITVSPEIFSNIRTGKLPSYQPHVPPFGGHILLTSGTTGTYKKIFLDPQIRGQKKYRARQRVSREQEHELLRRRFWPVGVHRLSRCPRRCGMPAAASSLIPGKTLRRFFRHRVDLAILTPLMLKKLIQALEPGSANDKCEVLVTAGFLTVELAKEATRRVTKRVGISYGCTELATPSLISRSWREGDMHWLRPTISRVIRIFDENGNECPPDQEGELRIALLDIDCTGYLDDDDASARMFRDGFFCPGDIAVRRPDGRVRILGRATDVLNVRGLKIAVAPIEAADPAGGEG